MAQYNRRKKLSDIFHLNKEFVDDNEWKVQDNIIKIQNIIPNQYPEFDSKMYIPKGKYFCIRDYKGTAIYILESDFDKFKKIKNIYNDDYNIINFTNLSKYYITGDCFATVANRTTPPDVSIKEIRYFNIDNIKIYALRSIKLHQQDTLFEDLLNLQNVKDKYKI